MFSSKYYYYYNYMYVTSSCARTCLLIAHHQRRFVRIYTTIKRDIDNKIKDILPVLWHVLGIYKLHVYVDILFPFWFHVFLFPVFHFILQNISALWFFSELKTNLQKSISISSASKHLSSCKTRCLCFPFSQSNVVNVTWYSSFIYLHHPSVFWFVTYELHVVFFVYFIYVYFVFKFTCTFTCNTK